MNNLKRYTFAALAAALFAGLAHASIDEHSTDTSKVEVGASNVKKGPHVKEGLPGIGLVNNKKLKRGIVDFQGLQVEAPPDSHGVSSIVDPSKAPTDHSEMGMFHFAKVSGANVYFGEWSQTSSVTDETHTVYYAGDDSGTTVPTDGTAYYSVKGISDYANKGLLSGTFEATFTGAGGIVTGSMSNGKSGAKKYNVDIGLTSIEGAKFSGNGAMATHGNNPPVIEGTVNGRFFGAGAKSLAGTIMFPGFEGNRGYDTAFGGAKK